MSVGVSLVVFKIMSYFVMAKFYRSAQITAMNLEIVSLLLASGFTIILYNPQ